MCPVPNHFICLGVKLDFAIKNCLLFEEGVVLMGKSEQELQIRLNIIAKFASKWNLKCNLKNSMVIVIGKIINKQKRWDLVDYQIKETNVYKCLTFPKMYLSYKRHS